jgi:lipoprotein signal peptidase
MPAPLAHRLDRTLRGDRRLTSRGPGRRATDDQPNRGWRPALLILVSVALADWLVKWSVARRLEVGDFAIVWDDRVALWHIQNPAMILGLYENLPLQYRMAIAALSGVLGSLLLFQVICRAHRLLPARRRWAWLFVGLAGGGMLGNLGERALHWTVTDYLSFSWSGIWLPPGNLADIAIFLSIPAAAMVIRYELEARAQRRPAHAAEAVPRPERYRSPVVEA